MHALHCSAYIAFLSDKSIHVMSLHAHNNSKLTVVPNIVPGFQMIKHKLVSTRFNFQYNDIM